MRAFVCACACVCVCAACARARVCVSSRARACVRVSVCERERAVSDLTLKCPSNTELQRVKAVRVCSGARLGLQAWRSCSYKRFSGTQLTLNCAAPRLSFVRGSLLLEARPVTTQGK